MSCSRCETRKLYEVIKRQTRALNTVTDGGVQNPPPGYNSTPAELFKTGGQSSLIACVPNAQST